jgi:hypothetical protein
MKRTALCLMFLLLSFMYTSNLYAEAPLVALDVKLDILAGQIKLTRIGNTKSDIISRPCQLYAGDLLETLKETKSMLTYADGTTMKLKERTLIEVQPTSIRVFRGKTWYKFTKRGTEFKIETPSLVAGIRGTEFEVVVSSRRKTSVSVLEGAVFADSKAQGKGALLTAGEAVSCDYQKPLSNKFGFNVADKNYEWNNDEWKVATATDVNSLFLNYLNFKNEFGDEDPRTIEIKRALDKARAKENK